MCTYSKTTKWYHLVENKIQLKICILIEYTRIVCGHSTETALLRVYNDIVTMVGKGNRSYLVLIDLSGAFDTIDHNTLFVKLEKYALQLLKSSSYFSYCCCCCLPSETYGRNGATPIFRSFFTEQPVPPQAAGVVGTFNVLDIYPSEHYGLSFFGSYGCLFFLQGLLFLYTFPFCKYTLHVCYVFNVNLTDSFDDRRSQCRLIE